MTQKLTILSALFLAALLSELKHARAQVPAPTPTPEYTIIDLGTLGGDYKSDASGINDHGQVVGSSGIGKNSYHAFLYSNGFMKDLGTLGGRDSHAHGINDSGQVVGSSQFSPDSTDYHAFLYSNGSMKDLGTLGGERSAAFSINDTGQVVGYSQVRKALFQGDYPNSHVFLYSNGSMKDLGTLGGDESFAYGINNHGQVVGESQLRPNSGGSHAFLYSNGSMKDLGTLGGERSAAFSINDTGQVVGYSQVLRRAFAGDYSDNHAFLYSNGSMKDLGTLSVWSAAFSINDTGQVVVYSALYSNGVRRDLNNLIHSTSGWQLVYARAINNAGQIVGYGKNASGKYHAFLLNPLPLGWRQTIEKQPPQPTYSEPPKEENAKDSLVVVTHGRVERRLLQASPPTNMPWVDDMVGAIRRNLESRGLTNWQVEPYKWIANAWTTESELLRGVTLRRAEDDGGNLGNAIASKEWKHVHLIAHSAGAALIQAAAEKIKDKWADKTTIHLTFLDPYVGVFYGGRSKYGYRADWSDNYFSRDLETSGETFTFTEGALKNAYNVDVTFLDKSKTKGNVYRSSSGLVVQQCQEATTTHEWPYKFYLETIAGSLPEAETKGLGFPISREGGNWDFAIRQYQKNSSPVPLGTLDPSCLPSLSETTPAYLGSAINFGSQTPVQSPTGLKEIFGTGFNLLTQSPAWLAVEVMNTNLVNFISFAAKFNSNGAEGMLSVYWDADSVGTIDERVAVPEMQQYTFAFPRTATNGTQMLGFRLDAFSSVQSSVTVTNVTLGFVGVREPFSLSFTGSFEDGLPVLQLNGLIGHIYSVEASSNLTDWETVATLLNTDGVVRFVDQTASVADKRFYRAIAP